MRARLDSLKIPGAFAPPHKQYGGTLDACRRMQRFEHTVPSAVLKALPLTAVDPCRWYPRPKRLLLPMHPSGAMPCLPDATSYRLRPMLLSYA